MDKDSQNASRPYRTLTDRALWKVLRVGALSALLACAVPLYYSLRLVAPGLAALVPELAVQAIAVFGLVVVFPAMFLYARRLQATTEPEQEVRYGVNDRWERENL